MYLNKTVCHSQKNLSKITSYKSLGYFPLWPSILIKSFSNSSGPKRTHEDNKPCNGMAFTYRFLILIPGLSLVKVLNPCLQEKKLKYYCLCLFCTIIKYYTLAIYNEQNLYRITVLVAGKSEMRALEFTFFLAC